MGLSRSSEFAIGQEVTVRDGWGDYLFNGLVQSRAGPFSLIVDGRFVSTTAVGVGKMSAENPWEHAPREMLEQALATQAATIAKMATEAEGLAEVIAMQCETMVAPTGTNIAAAEGNDWGERLVDLLELYLVRTVGERRPLRIADPNLRALVSHILD